MDDKYSVSSPREELHTRYDPSTCRQLWSGVAGGMTRGETTGEALGAACSLAKPGNRREETGFFQMVLGHSQAMTMYSDWVCAKDLGQKDLHVGKFCMWIREYFFFMLSYSVGYRIL